MENRIKAKDYTLYELFYNDILFVVPNYQRRYSWDKEKSIQFIDSIINKSLQDKDSYYFLGTIVLQEKNKNDKVYNIIDGQQRLTTLILILNSIYHTLRKKNYKNIEELKLLIYRNKKKLINAISEGYKVKLSDNDNNTLVDLLNNRLLENSNKSVMSKHLLIENSAVFDEKLSRLENEKILEFTKYLLNKSVLVVVSAIQDKEAINVFTTINEGGVPLNNYDKLKPIVLLDIENNISRKKSLEYSKKWEEVEDKLQNQGIDKLLQNYRDIEFLKRAKNNIYTDIKEEIIPKLGAKNFTDKLVLRANIQFKILNQKFSNTDFHENNIEYRNETIRQINQEIYWLLQLDEKKWIAPLIYFYETQKDYSPNELAANFHEFVWKLTRLAIIINTLEDKERRDEYYNLMQEIKDYKKPKDIEMLNIKKAISRHDLKKVLIDPHFCKKHNRKKFAKIILLKLEQHNNKNSHRTQIIRDISVEHILPQNPKTGSQWRKDFSDSDIKKHVNMLGNLTLLTKDNNRKAANKEFEEKKIIYKEDTAISNEDILNNMEWNKYEIMERTNILAKEIMESIFDAPYNR